MTLVPLDPATLGPLASTPALSGVLETLSFAAARRSATCLLFRRQRHLVNDTTATLLPMGAVSGCAWPKALAELEIRLLVVGLLQQLTLALEADQDLTLKVIPSPSPADGLLVRAYSRAS